MKTQKLLLSLIALFMVATAWGQTISGTVTNAAASGAAICVDGTLTGITANYGGFTSAPPTVKYEIRAVNASGPILKSGTAAGVGNPSGSVTFSSVSLAGIPQGPYVIVLSTASPATSFEIPLRIDGRPTVTVTPQTVCLADIASKTVKVAVQTPADGATYTWAGVSAPGGLATAITPAGDTKSATFKFGAGGTASLYATPTYGTSSIACPATAASWDGVNPPAYADYPQAKTVDLSTAAVVITKPAANTTICKGSSITLEATVGTAATCPAGLTAQWLDNGVVISESAVGATTTKVTYTVTPVATAYYSIRCALKDGSTLVCAGPVSSPNRIITLADKPTVPAYTQPTFCQGQAIAGLFNINQTCTSGTAEYFDPRVAPGSWVAGPLVSLPTDATITSTVVGQFDATTNSSDNVIRTWKLRCNNGGCTSDEVVIKYNVTTGISAPTGVSDKVFCDNTIANTYNLDKTVTCPAGTKLLVYYSINAGGTGAASTSGDPVSTSSVAKPSDLKGTTGQEGTITFDAATGKYSYSDAPYGTGDARDAGQSDVAYFHFFCYGDANGSGTFDPATECVSPSTVGKVTELVKTPSVSVSNKVAPATTFTAGSSVTVCQNVAVTLKANCPIGFNAVWNDGSTNAELTVSTANVGIQTITVKCKTTESACSNESTTATATVTVNAGSSEAPVIRANSTVCAGSPSVYVEGTCTPVSWQYKLASAASFTPAVPEAVINGQFAFATGTTGPNSSQLVGLTPGTYQVQARCGAGDCVSPWSETLTVEVGPSLLAPKFAIVEPNSTSTDGNQLQLVCAGSQIKLVLTDGYTCPGTMNWYYANTSGALGSGTTSIGTGNPSQIFNVPTNTPTVFISATCSVGNCVSPIAEIPSALVVVVPPTATAKFETFDSNSACLPASATTNVKLKVTCPGSVGLLVPTLTRQINGGTKVTFTAASTSVATNIVSSLAPFLGVIDEYTFTIPTSAPATPGTTQTITYEATCINVGIGGYTSDPLQTSCQKPMAVVTIKSTPNAPEVTAATIAGCGSATLPTVTCAAGSTAEWLNAAGSVVTSPVTVSGAYKARCTKDGCSSPASVNAITVNITPSTIAFTIKADKTTLCATGGSVVLSVATGSCAGTITWMEGTTTLGTGATFTVTPGTATSYTYSAVCKDGACEKAADNTATITREAVPTITLVPSTTAICAGSTSTITATTGFVSYEFFKDGVSLGAASASNTYTASAAGEYTVKVTNANGCSYTSTAKAVVNTIAGPSSLTLTSSASGIICAGSGIVLTLSGCPAGANYSISNGAANVASGTSGGSIVLNINAVPVGNASDITYTATCTVGSAGCTANSSTVVKTSPLDVRWVNVGQTSNAMRPAGQGFTTTEWPTVNATSGPNAMNSTSAVRTVLDYTGPRYWNLEAFYCVTATPKTVEFVLVNETTSQTFKTVEGTAPWFMFGNARSGNSSVADSYFQLWTIDDPNYGFGPAYSANGLPKGKYTLTIRAISVGPAIGSPYPPTRIADQDPANTIVARTFYFDVANSQAARQGLSESSEETFVSLGQNPVTNTLSFTINGAKGQDVNLNLVDATGRLIKSALETPETNTHRVEMDMSSNTTGMYFLKVTSASKNATLKVLKVN